MSLERNKELARAAIAIWSTGDFSRVLEIFTPDYVMHQHHHGAAGGTGGLGLKAMRAFAHEFRTGFPDFHDTIDLQLAEGDLVATRFTSSGTHTGPFQGIAPTGREAELDRHRDRPGPGRSDRRELGQLGHDGHAAATRGHPDAAGHRPSGLKTGPEARSGSEPKGLNSPAWRRALWIALAVNAGMFLAEIVAGVAAGSSALQADALDFLGDAANYAISLTVAGMVLHWRARAALLKGASLLLLGLWVLGSTAWHAYAGTLPQAEVMGVVGVLALVANGGGCPHALPLPGRRREHALGLDLLAQRRHRQRRRACWRRPACSAPARAGRISSSPRSWRRSGSAAGCKF